MTKDSANRARPIVPLLTCVLCWTALSLKTSASDERFLKLAEITNKPALFQAGIEESGMFTWWLPQGADEYVLPVSAGVIVDTSRSDMTRWLRRGSPWSLSELPAVGLRYGDQMVVVIVPWPHYAELVAEDRLGIRFSFPEGRHKAAPCEIVAVRRGSDPLEVAWAFREWRRSAPTIGAIPRQRLLTEKAEKLNSVARLFGAPHIYLWGPALFSRHDIPNNRWVAFARALSNAPDGAVGNWIVKRFTDDQRGALRKLADAEWPARYLTVNVAAAVDDVLTNRSLLNLDSEVTEVDVIERKKGVCRYFCRFRQSSGLLG